MKGGAFYGNNYVVESLGFGYNAYDEYSGILLIDKQSEAEVAEKLGSNDDDKEFLFGLGTWKGKIHIFFVITNMEMNFMIPLTFGPDTIHKFFDTIIETDKLGIATIGDNLGTFFRSGIALPARSFLDELEKYMEVW
jgi:hypothetical protein